MRYLLSLSLALSLNLSAGGVPLDEQATPNQSSKDGLTLTAHLDKNAYLGNDAIVLSFELINVSQRDRYISDGFLAPATHEAGPGRHFEVHVTNQQGRRPLYFWSGTLTEGRASGIRKSFKLKPGDKYTGKIVIKAPEGGGSFEDIGWRKQHVLGVDGRKYTLELVYQVPLDVQGVWEAPPGFKIEMLWKGTLRARPIEFEVAN